MTRDELLEQKWLVVIGEVLDGKTVVEWPDTSALTVRQEEGLRLLQAPREKSSGLLKCQELIGLINRLMTEARPLSMEDRRTAAKLIEQHVPFPAAEAMLELAKRRYQARRRAHPKESRDQAIEAVLKGTGDDPHNEIPLYSELSLSEASYLPGVESVAEAEIHALAVATDKFKNFLEKGRRGVNRRKPKSRRQTVRHRLTTSRQPRRAGT